MFDIAGVSGVVMTNDPLDEAESRVWKNGVNVDQRFKASLRLDSLLNDFDSGSGPAIRRLLDQSIQRLNPVYLAASLPADFKYPSDDVGDELFREVVLPTAKEYGLTLTLMVGVRRAVNPKLREAGDALGRADVTAIERLCAEIPKSNSW